LTVLGLDLIASQDVSPSRVAGLRLDKKGLALHNIGTADLHRRNG
jgi:hypothetical protein